MIKISQAEIYELLRKNPRLCEKEICNMINKRSCSVARSLKSMIKYKEVRAFNPNEEEKERIASKFSNSRKAINNLKVFAVVEDDI